MINKILSNDSLDQEKQKYNRNHSGSLQLGQQQNPNLLLKDLYRQQLDEFVRQKLQQQQLDRQRHDNEKRSYNEKIQASRETQKLKDISYKKYYQMLLDNQTCLTHSYVDQFQERDSIKEKHINLGVAEQLKKKAELQQRERKRNEVHLNNYKSGLISQIQAKKLRHASEIEEKTKIAEELRKYTPSQLQVDRYERDRKVLEMQKYREDLDRQRNSRVKSTTVGYNNDFNLQGIEARHDLLLNPLPYNIQNPYILKELQRRSPETTLNSATQ